MDSTPSSHTKGRTPSDTSSTEGASRSLTTRSRVGGPKSRKGCVVCKIRRVKCDETKPFCTRCTSTGRRCEGYAPEQSRGKIRKPSGESHAEAIEFVSQYTPSLDIEGTPDERRSFHYFRSRNMSEMPGNFEPYFWNSIVLQFSHTFPTVRQSLIALSGIYEQRERSSELSGRRSSSDSHDERTLQQYNKAVTCLVEYLSSDNQDPKVALISCLIFVWIEFLQNELEVGFRHLDSGLSILRDYRHSMYDHPGLYQDPEDIYGSLDRSFVRLSIQAAIHGSRINQGNRPSSGRVSPVGWDVVPPIPASFSSVYESRKFLDKELQNTFGYIRDLSELGYYSSIDPVVHEEIRDEHLARLSEWQAATRAMLTYLGDQNQAQSSGVMYLQLYYTFIKVLWTSLFARSEMVFDDHTADFEIILTLAESLLDNPKSTSPTILSFDMGIIPPLFYVLLKCRVLGIRQKAISLLKAAPEREGMWDRDSVVRYAEWKMNLEEKWGGDTKEGEALPLQARIYQEYIPEKAIITRGGKSWYPLRISFRRGPAGLDITDTVEMEGDLDVANVMGQML